ncbi:MAG: histidine kinase [Bacteroidetes bacterium]|jgi:signal transduction histidine kinase|nr:histidine kinase [Bacteroidota bacterium]
MNIRIQLFSGFLILALAFLVVFYVNQRLYQEVLNNTNYLNNSETVIRNSNVLHKKIIEMQSGFRGFLLTGQESFLTSYSAGISSLPPLITEQRSLLSSPDQKKRLDSISTLHDQWMVYADSLILSKKDTLPEAEIRYKRLIDRKLKMEVGKKLNDMISTVFLYFDDEEYNLRQKRRAVLQQSIQSTKNISIILSVGVILLAFIAFLYFIKMITGRISQMANLADRISKGSFISMKYPKKDEFTKLVNSLNLMSETLDKNFKELKQKNKELDQFAYVVSHDLKAPLRGISNIVDWIEEDHENDITSPVGDMLHLIKGRTLRLENMINGLLEYAKIGRIKKGVEDVDLNTLIAEIKDMVVPTDVPIFIEDTLPVLKAQRIHLEQVFTNLIGNAIKYNKSNDPRIFIRSTDLGEYYQFSVEDNGPGIEERYFEKIFEIFQTLQERDAFESTGVGLAIVKKIIEDNKGTIRVESVIGKGSTFIFTWPKKLQNEKENTADRR